MQIKIEHYKFNLMYLYIMQKYFVLSLIYAYLNYIITIIT